MNTRISSPANLLLAVQRVQEKYPLLRDRAWLNDDLEIKLIELGRELADGTFRPSQVSLFYSMLDKPLLCAGMDCRSWLAHEAIVGPLSDFFAEKAVAYCTCKPEQTNLLLTRCRRWKRSQAWVAGADIHRFFDSVQHAVLLEVLAQEIPCPTTLRLITTFLEVFDLTSLEFAGAENNHTHHPNKGLPAGNELVYCLTNALLLPIDRRMNALTSGCYARYMDDFLFFAPDENALHTHIRELQSGLARLDLTLNAEKTFFLPTTAPFHFLRSVV
ncbi:MAG: RNA-directed DNA polymerase [Saprospiraceae bacterium]